jgi:hypothetical protein
MPLFEERLKKPRQWVLCGELDGEPEIEDEAKVVQEK